MEGQQEKPAKQDSGKMTAKKHTIAKDWQKYQSFLIWCTPELSKVNLLTAVHALYYLPTNFMLMLPRTALQGNKQLAAQAEASDGRVRPYADKVLTPAELLLLADVVLHDKEVRGTSAGTAKIINMEFFRANNSEALASKLLGLFNAM